MRFLLTIVLFNALLFSSAIAPKQKSQILPAQSIYKNIIDNEEIFTDKLDFKKADVNIAILLPKKISGSYITRTPKSILSYLIYNNKKKIANTPYTIYI